MRVFALNERAAGVGFGVFYSFVDGPVHRANNVGVIFKLGTLILHGAALVAVLYPLVGLLKYIAVACLVAERPHDDARVILVALHQSLSAVHVCRVPFGIESNVFAAVAKSVRLDVSLVDYVEAIFVAHFIEIGGLRIVAGADGVHIGTLHLLEIFHEVVARAYMSKQWIVLVEVYALDEHILAIHKQHAVLNLRGAESYLVACSLDGVALSVFEGSHHSVEIRGLGTPVEHFQSVARYFHVIA